MRPKAGDCLGCQEARSFPEMFAAAGDPTYDADEEIRVLFASPIDWHEDVACPGITLSISLCEYNSHNIESARQG